MIVETANPAKFPEEIEKVVGWSPDVPPAWQRMKLPEDFDRMGADYEKFKAYLIEQHHVGLIVRRLISGILPFVPEISKHGI